MATSIATLLKDIAITSFELGKAQTRETLSTLFAQARESRIGQLLETARQRIGRNEAAQTKSLRKAA